MARNVLCPKCGMSNEFPRPVLKSVEPVGEDLRLVFSNVEAEPVLCCSCGEPLDLAFNDFQNVRFVEINDGYHSWYSRPTSIHTVWRCVSPSILCEQCLHNAASDTFCYNRRIDIRKPY